MKKLVTLILVLAGIVGTASADTVKKRIFIQNSGSWATPTLYMWKSTDETSQPLGEWPGTGMSNYNSAYENWYFIDVTLEKDTDYKMILNNNGGGTQSAEISFNSADNKFFAVWGEGNSDYNVNDLTYYLYDTSNGSTTEMELNDDLELSITIDNNAGLAKYYVIAPSFVTSWYGDDDKRWNLMIRPYSDYQTLSFQNITSDQEYAKVYGGGGTNAWYTNHVTAFFDLTVDLSNWTYSISPYFTRTINASAGYATFSSAYNVAIPDGVDAYWGKEVTDGKIVMKKYTKGIPAEVGALLSGSGVVTFTPTTETDEVTAGSNLLKASVTDTELTGGSTSPYYYILGGTSAENVGFYYVNTTRNSGAGKAYLATTTALASENANARAAWIFDEEGETTGIAAVKASQKMNGEFFNLAGQRVAQPTKGLYIVNGKKVIMK